MNKLPFCLVLVLLLTTVNCSRKGDESLPPRVGDLNVRIKLIDDLNYFYNVSHIPMQISIYAKDSITLLTSATVQAVPNEVTSYVFKDLGATITGYYISLGTAFGDSAKDGECSEMYAVFVQEGIETSTAVYQIKYRPGNLICSQGS